MSDDPDIPAGEGPDLAAAEYVLGLLEGSERAAAGARIEADAAFATSVDRWGERLAPLLDGVPAEPPPPALWAAIERRIGGGGAEDAKVVRLRRRAALWRGYGVAATAVAAALVGAIVTRPPAIAPPPSARAAPVVGHAMVAMLAGKAGGMAMMASYDPAERSLVFAPGRMPAMAAGRAHELWIIPAGGAPRSLGVMPAGPGRMTMAPPLAAMVDARATLAVSVEPAGGSPTGSPTGPVVASGKFTLV